MINDNTLHSFIFFSCLSFGACIVQAFSLFCFLFFFILLLPSKYPYEERWLVHSLLATAQNSSTHLRASAHISFVKLIFL